MRIAITGATGLLGSELVRYFVGQGETVIPLPHELLDVTKRDRVLATLREQKPDIIINCAVILDVDKCEADQTLCYAVNRDAVENFLASILELGLYPVFVQMSSSETFGRVHEGEYDPLGYTEDAVQKPASAYQKSKKESEDILLAFVKKNPNVLRRWYIPRAGWLYGEGRPTFVDRFFTLLQSKEPLTVIKDQWRSPTWTRDFVRGLSEMLGHPSGIYHIVNEVKPGEATTQHVIDELEKYLGDRAAHPPMTFVAQQEFFKVYRAPSNVLKNIKLPKLPYWRDTLQEYLTKKYPL